MYIQNEKTIPDIEQQLSQSDSKFFYGWVVLFFSAISVIVSTGLLIGGFTHFSKSFIDEFGWSRTAIGIAGSLALITRSMTAPFTGRLWDKYGPKRFMAPAIVLAGITLLFGTMISKPSHYWAMMFMFAVCITLCGLGPSFYLASTWFREKRGISLALVGMGSSVGVTVLSPLTVHFILKYGWRMTIVIYAVFNILIVAPLVHLFIKNHPSDIDTSIDPDKSDWILRHSDTIRSFIIAIGITGLFFYSPVSKYSINRLGMMKTLILMAALFIVTVIIVRVFFTKKNDGAQTDKVAATSNYSVRGGATFREAIRHPIFWLLLLGSSICYLFIISIPQHFILHIQSKEFGISQREAGWILSTLFFFGLFGRGLFGYLSDRFHKRVMNLICSIILFSGLFVLFNLTPQNLWTFCFLFGLGYSGVTVTAKQVLAEQFGLNSLGKLLGIMLGAETFFGGIGVIMMGRTHDILGSYQPAFKVLLITSVFSVIFMSTLLLTSVKKTTKEI